MTKPLFTIGIPTFNRVEFLKESLASALSQGYPEMQVLVCDNASNDGTEKYVRSIQDSRVKYHRNSENIGAQRNFLTAASMADGEYFSWLQDDDLIVPDFAERAVECLDRYGASLYLGSALYSESAECMYWPGVYCPPLKMGWTTQKEMLVDAATILGLSLLISVAIPPVVAFRTEVLKSHATSLSTTNFPLYVERTLLCEVAMQGVTVADPKVCGLFRKHNNQSSQLLLSDGERSRAEWLSMADYVDQLQKAAKMSDLQQIRDCFESVPALVLKAWMAESERWPLTNSVAVRVRSLLKEIGANRGLARRFGALKRGEKILRSFVPPILNSATKQTLSMIRHALSRKK